MRVIVDYAFREMGLHRIQLLVAPFNPAGIRAYEKAGFVEEGRHREAVWHDGRWYDEVCMSVLDHEWGGVPRTPMMRARAILIGLCSITAVMLTTAGPALASTPAGAHGARLASSAARPAAAP